MSASTAAVDRQARTSARQSVSVMGAIFLVQFELTALVPAQALIAEALQIDGARASWIIDSYSLAFAVTLIAAGALSERFGPARIFAWGNLAFALCSILCAASSSPLTFVAARAGQGLGAAFLVTGALSLMAQLYPLPSNRTKAFGRIGMVSGVAMTIGPAAGGLLAAQMGWQTLFLANLPCCALIGLLAPRIRIATRSHDSSRPLDFVGIALFTTALGLAICSLIEAANTSWLLVGLGVSVGLAIAFVRHQQNSAAPLLNLSLYATPTMLAIGSLLCAVSISYWAVLVHLPHLLQHALAWTPELAGVGLVFTTLPMLVLPPIAAQIILRIGWRLHYTASLGAIAAGNVTLAFGVWADANSPVLALLGMAAIGTGAALANAQLSGAALSLVPPERSGMASALTMVTRQAAFALGIAVLTAVLHATSGGLVAMLAVSAATSLAGAICAAALLPARTATSK